ncbi:MAG: methyltransferase domain-containing protein, partial [Nevskiales bacterium]
DHVFDVVCGIQTLEHWEEPGSRFCVGGYQEVLGEVWRVLKPGGWIYLDAPIHVHGAPEFVRGDVDKIRMIFSYQDWRNVRLMSWRRLHEPLRMRYPPKLDQGQWTRCVPDSTADERAKLAMKSAWVIAIRADKPPPE